jgi:hypothetical protein
MLDKMVRNMILKSYVMHALLEVDELNHDRDIEGAGDVTNPNIPKRVEATIQVRWRRGGTTQRRLGAKSATRLPSSHGSSQNSRLVPSPKRTAREA